MVQNLLRAAGSSDDSVGSATLLLPERAARRRGAAICRLDLQAGRPSPGIFFLGLLLRVWGCSRRRGSTTHSRIHGIAVARWTRGRGCPNGVGSSSRPRRSRLVPRRVLPLIPLLPRRILGMATVSTRSCSGISSRWFPWSSLSW